MRMISYYRSIVTMALSCIVSHTQPDIGRKSRNFYTLGLCALPMLRCSSFLAYTPNLSRFFCCCSIHLELSTCWDSTVRKHSHFQTPLYLALYKSVIIIIIIIILNFLNPRKTRVGKKLKKLKRMERLMSRAVVQLKTIVQQNRIETK